MEELMKILIIFLFLFISNSYSSECEPIEELGFPIVGKCRASGDSIRNIDSKYQIVEASVCWGSIGNENDGDHAVAVSMTTMKGEIIEYTWDMPAGRNNRTSVNDYTYFGRWKKGTFYEDQTTVNSDDTFFKPFLRQGVVINYRDKEIELVKTYKKFWGQQQILIDAFLDCESFKSRI